jgi:hypothetical protein
MVCAILELDPGRVVERGADDRRVSAAARDEEWGVGGTSEREKERIEAGADFGTSWVARDELRE